MQHVHTLALFLLLVVVSPFAYSQSTSSKVLAEATKGGNDLSNGLTSALRSNNLTQTAAFIEQQIQQLLPILQAPGQKTFLVPTDDAWQAKGNASLPGGAGMVELLSYHILNDTVRQTDVPRHGFNVQITPTMFNASTKPVVRPQVVVLAKEAGTERVDVVQAKENVSFSLPSADGVQYQNYLLQPIDRVLSVPSDVSTVSQQLNLEQVSALLDIGGLQERVRDANLITLFAPTQDAITKAVMDIATIGTQGQLDTVLNHIINGTSIFSTEMPAKEDQDAPNAIRSFISAAGQEVRIVNKDGQLSLVSGALSAKIVRSDILLHNGVVHLVDAVLINTKLDAQSAQRTAQAAAAQHANAADAVPGAPLWGYGMRGDAGARGSAQHSGSRARPRNSASTAILYLATLALFACIASL